MKEDRFFNARNITKCEYNARYICIINKMLGLSLSQENDPEERGAQLSYYTKCYRKRSSRTTGRFPRLSFDPALIFGANEQNPPPPIISVKTFHSLSLAARFAPTPFHLYSPRIIDCPGHRFVHVQRAPAQARAQGNSYDYRGMIPSGLTRLLTKLFDRTNSGTPRGRAYTAR